MVNLTDLKYIWLGYEEASPAQLSQYVHSGTYLLILSLVLAMGLLLWFFRANLNFFPDNLRLKQLAYAWIIQNAVLTLSVGMRNYYYIAHYGLAYKRLGVILFLLFVMAGLCSLYVKVKHQKSLAYLLLINGWIVYYGFLAASAVNWDIAITKYNLNANLKGGLDIEFLIGDVSTKNLYLLEKHREKIIEMSGIPANTIERRLNAKKRKLGYELEGLSWRSWNRADEMALGEQ